MATPPPAGTRRYRLYIDESGDPSYGRLDVPHSRYLGVLGVWFERPEPYTRFANGLEDLKVRVFGPSPTGTPVVLHRKCLVNRKGVFGLLNDEAKREQFDQGLLSLITATTFKVVCVVIDKASHQERYASPKHPYHYCLAAMLERYCGWLDRFGSGRGDVVAESRGKEEDRSLCEAYTEAYLWGTDHHDAEQFQRVLSSPELTVAKKTANIAGLQLADILAQPVRQYCLEKRGVCTPGPPCFGTTIREAIMRKFNRQVYQDRIEGYGTVWLSA